MTEADDREKESRDDAHYMSEALKEARKAYARGEAPVGAVIVRDRGGEIIARGRNEREAKGDPTLHAEMTAIRRAARRMGTWRLEGCSIYATLEPCAMCAGAIVQSRIAKLVFGAKDTKAGAAGSVVDIFKAGMFNHDVEVTSGVLEAECSDLLKRFFGELRTGKAAGKATGKAAKKEHYCIK